MLKARWRGADDDDEPGGSQRCYDVYLLVPQPEYMWSRPWPRFFGDARRVMHVWNLTEGEKSVGFNTTGPTLAGGGFSKPNHHLPRVVRAGTAFAN